MKCKQIEFTNFRNMDTADISFSDGINVLWGKNAQGKSNILEGIYYFARGRSFRGAKDREMIRFGEDFSKLKKNTLQSRSSSEGGYSKVYKYSDEKGTKFIVHEVTDIKGYVIHRDFDAVRISSGQIINKGR